MAADLRVVLLVSLVATVTATVLEEAEVTVSTDTTHGCVTKAWGVTSGHPAPIKPATLPSNVYDFDVQISNPCSLAKKVGIIVTVCDPNSTPEITVYSADEVHVHRFLPIHPASFTGKVFCLSG